jgi:hypothetical protein
MEVLIAFLLQVKQNNSLPVENKQKETALVKIFHIRLLLYLIYDIVDSEIWHGK